MTKARDPQTMEDAILRIVDRIGWAAAADVVGKGERVVRNWSDPDFDRRPDFEECIALDRAFMTAGGDAPPLWTVMGSRLDRAMAPPADSAAIALATGIAAKETGEAIAAGVAAAQPGASQKVRVVAEQELDEAISSLQSLKSKLGVDAVVH